MPTLKEELASYKSLSSSEKEELNQEEGYEFKTAAEVILLRRWKNSQKHLKELEKRLLSLETQMKNQNSDLDGYHTDEAEFDPQAKSNDWILKLGRKTKKRKAQSSPEVSPPKPEGTLPKKKVVSLPPIFVKKVEDIQKLTMYLKKQQMKAKISTLSTEGNFKVNCCTEEEYMELSAWLNEKNIQWHTFSNKQKRPLRVMARGLHYKTMPADILQDLTSQGLLATEAVNILNSRTKKPLNLFMLTFSELQDPKKVYNVRVIEHQTVKIEEIHRKSKKIVQCKKCQDYNHVKSFCHSETKCVRCAGNHLSIDCPEKKDTPPKCANCGGNHTANYRGCEYARGLQAARDKKANKSSNAPKSLNEPKILVSKKADGTVTYAQSVKNISPTTGNSSDPIMNFLERLEERLTDQDKKIGLIIKQQDLLGNWVRSEIVNMKSLLKK